MWPLLPALCCFRHHFCLNSWNWKLILSVKMNLKWNFDQSDLIMQNNFTHLSLKVGFCCPEHPMWFFFLTLLLLWGLIFASPDWFLLLIFFLIDFCFCSLISGFAGLFVFWLIFVSAGWFLLLLINFFFLIDFWSLFPPQVFPMLEGLTHLVSVMVDCINFAPYGTKFQPKNRCKEIL